MEATELFEGIEAIPGSKDAGSADGVPQSWVVNGIEFGSGSGTDDAKSAPPGKDGREAARPHCC